MPRGEEWITTQKAAEIISRNSGHEVPPDYVRSLGRRGKIRFKALDERTNVYWRDDVEHLTVQARPRKEGGKKSGPKRGTLPAEKRVA